MGQTLLHHHSSHVRRVGGIACHFDTLQGDGVPFRLAQLKLTVQLEVQGVVSPHLDVLVLLYVAALQPEHTCLGVEVDALHCDRQGGAHPIAGGGAGGSLVLHLANGGAAHAVALRDQIISMPHVLGLLWHQGHIAAIRNRLNWRVSLFVIHSPLHALVHVFAQQLHPVDVLVRISILI